MRNIYLLFFLIMSTGLIAQVESNAFFEVLETIEKPHGSIHYSVDNYFVITKDYESNSILVDTSGNKANLPCTSFSYDNNMSGDLIYCHQGKKKGIFSVAKNKLLTPNFDTIQYINQNFYSAQRGGQFLLYNKDHQLINENKTQIQLDRYYQHCDDNHIVVYGNDHTKYLDINGNELSKYRCIGRQPAFSDGSYLYAEKEKLGVKSSSGQIIIPADFDEIEKWDEGGYIVGKSVLNTEQSGSVNSFRNMHKTLKGILDNRGETILPFEYEYIYPYPFGFVVRKPGCKSVLLSDTFENVYDREFTTIKASSNGFILLKDDTGLYYDLVFDSKGWVLQSGIKSGNQVNQDLTALKLENGNQTLVDKEGKVVYSTEEEDLQFKFLTKDLIQCKGNSSAGVLRNNGTWFLEPGKYQISKKNRIGGFFIYDLDKRFRTLYNSDGKKIETNFETATIIPNTNAYILSKQDKVGVIDDTGKTLIPFEYEKIDEFNKSPGYYKIKDGNKLHLVKIKK